MYNFDFILDDDLRNELKNGYEIITRLELWDRLNGDPYIRLMRILTNHSRELIRHLKYIATYGEDAFKAMYLQHMRNEHEKSIEFRQIQKQYIISRL